MKKVRWGILSTANIGREKVVPAIQKAIYCEVVAIASRSMEQAQNAAAALQIPKAYRCCIYSATQSHACGMGQKSH